MQTGDSMEEDIYLQEGCRKSEIEKPDPYYKMNIINYPLHNPKEQAAIGGFFMRKMSVFMKYR